MPVTKLNQDIPDTDHIVRYLNKEKWCPSNGAGIGVAAFQCDPSRGGVSCNWLEYFFRDDEGRSLRRINKTCGLKTRGSGRFLKLQVGDIRRAILESYSYAQVIHDGEDQGDNESHAEIHPPVQAIFTALVLCAEEDGVLLEVPS